MNVPVLIELASNVLRGTELPRSNPYFQALNGPEDTEVPDELPLLLAALISEPNNKKELKEGEAWEVFHQSVSDGNLMAVLDSLSTAEGREILENAMDFYLPDEDMQKIFNQSARVVNEMRSGI